MLEALSLLDRIHLHTLQCDSDSTKVTTTFDEKSTRFESIIFRGLRIGRQKPIKDC